MFQNALTNLNWIYNLWVTFLDNMNFKNMGSDFFWIFYKELEKKGEKMWVFVTYSLCLGSVRIVFIYLFWK